MESLRGHFWWFSSYSYHFYYFWGNQVVELATNSVNSIHSDFLTLNFLSENFSGSGLGELLLPKLVTKMFLMRLEFTVVVLIINALMFSTMNQVGSLVHKPAQGIQSESDHKLTNQIWGQCGHSRGTGIQCYIRSLVYLRYDSRVAMTAPFLKLFLAYLVKDTVSLQTWHCKVNRNPAS